MEGGSCKAKGMAELSLILCFPNVNAISFGAVIERPANAGPGPQHATCDHR